VVVDSEVSIHGAKPLQVIRVAFHNLLFLVENEHKSHEGEQNTEYQHRNRNNSRHNFRSAV